MDTFKLFINPKTRNAPHETFAEMEKKVSEEPPQSKSDEKDQADGGEAGPRGKEKEEEKLKARFKEYGSNITFTSVSSKPSELKKSTGQRAKSKKEEGKKSKDETSWTSHPLLPKGWCVAPLLQQPPAQLLAGLKVVQLQGDQTRIQLRAPGGRVLGSHGEAAAFMEEEGSYGEEDIQNLYKVSLVQPVEKTESKSDERKSNPAAPRRPGGTVAGRSGLQYLVS